MVSGIYGETDSGLMVFHAAVMAADNIGSEAGAPFRRTILEFGTVINVAELAYLSEQHYYSDVDNTTVAVTGYHAFGFDEFGSGEPRQKPHAPGRDDAEAKMTIMGAVVLSYIPDNKFGQHAVTMRSCGRGWVDAITDGRQDLTLIGIDSLVKYEAALTTLRLEGQHPLRAVVSEALHCIRQA